MKTADLITSFLENELTPEQERQFLLSVAASDSLRLSLKSHVMLDRISADQLHRAHVPVGVREAIFAQAAVAVAEFPLPGESARAPVPDMKGTGGRFAGGLLRKYGSHALTVLLTAGSFVAGYLVHPEGDTPAALQVQEVQARQAAPAETFVPGSVNHPAETIREGAGPVSAVASENDAIAEQAGEPQLREDRTVARRTISRRDNGVANRAIRSVQPRSVSGPSLLSSPLEPADGLKSAKGKSSAAAGMNADDTTNEVNPIPNQSVSVQVRVRTSRQEPVQEFQTQQGD